MKRINLNKIVNTRKLVHRIFIMLWVVLAFCLAFKFLFNWDYSFKTNNQVIIAVANFLEENDWSYYIYSLSVYLIIGNLWTLISIRQKKYKKKLYFLYTSIILALIHLVKWFNITVGNIVEIFYLVGATTFYNIKNKTFKKLVWNILYAAIIYGGINLWQLNILFVRNINEILSNANRLVTILMQVDYFIFIIILYGEVNMMGLFGGWFFGKSETELLALKEEELKKEKPDYKKIEEIDKRLEELKSKAK